MSPELFKTLLEENQDTERSMGIIKPDPGSVKFKVKDASLNDTDDQEIANMVYEQSSLLEDPLKSLIKPKYSFSYHYTCDGHPHKHQIHDWEVQATYFNYKRRYKTEEETLAKMTQEYQQNIPNQNLHFIMGTMARHRRTFIMIGLLRTTVDIDAMDKQTELF